MPGTGESAGKGTKTQAILTQIKKEYFKCVY